MGLDVDIIKFDKPEFDRLCAVNKQPWFDFIDTDNNYEQLAQYRKYYEVRDILIRAVGSSTQQTIFELTESQIDFALCIASNGQWRDEDEVEELIKDLERIRKETDFVTEVVAFMWCS